MEGVERAKASSAEGVSAKGAPFKRAGAELQGLCQLIMRPFQKKISHRLHSVMS